MLRLLTALIGCSTKPLDRLDVVLLHALTLIIHEAKVALPISIALVGRSAIPLDRLGVHSKNKALFFFTPGAYSIVLIFANFRPGAYSVVLIYISAEPVPGVLISGI